MIRKMIARWASPIRATAKEFIDTRALANLPLEDVGFECLRELDQLRLAAYLNSDTISSEWFEDLAVLDKVNPPDFASGVNPGDQRALYSLVRALKPSRILEVGTHIGSSTIALALACGRNRDSVEDPTIVTVDIRDVNDEVIRPWEFFGSDASPRRKLQHIGLESFVQFIVGDSLQELPKISEPFDFVFLDGSHQAPTVYREVAATMRCLCSDGVVVMHDIFPDGKRLWAESRPSFGPWKAISRLLSENPGLRIIPLGELPWSTKYGSCITSLAVLSHRS